MDGRARKGGQVGKNGEAYRGGQFLPASAYTVKGAVKGTSGTRGTGREKIAQGQWAEAPEPGARAIFGLIAGTSATLFNGKLEPFQPYLDYAVRTHGDSMVLGHEVADLCERWNQGERWIFPVA